MKRLMQDLGDLAGLDIEAVARRAPTPAARPVETRSNEISADAEAKPAAAAGRCRDALRRVLRDSDLARLPALIRR